MLSLKSACEIFIFSIVFYPLMKNFAKVLFLLLSAFLWFWVTIIEPYFIIDYDFAKITSSSWTKELDGLKIALIADIHYTGGAVENWRLNNIIKKTNDAKPDIIILLGDYFQAGSPKRINLDLFSSYLKKLYAPLGVYAILGNHDSYFGRNIVRDMISNAGIKVLENSNVKVKTPKGDFYLAAIADMITQNHFYTLALKGIPESAPTIFLSHTPDGFKYSPNDVKIMFSGHTHGGQIKIPHYGAIFVNLRFDRIADGKLYRDGKTLYVSKGLGTSRIPVRFLCSPTIVIATISKE